MTTQHLVTMKPDFLAEVNKLPIKEAQQVYNKLHLLTQDPTPDAKVKKQLKYMHGGHKIHRIRSGYYRIFYTFDQQYISILALRRRDDDTYEDDLDEEFLGGLPIDSSASPDHKHVSHFNGSDWESILISQSRPLPEPITVELLNELNVPSTYHKRLVLIKDQDALLSCPGVDEEILLRIDQYMFEMPITEVVCQPDLILNEVDDLLRYREGELLGFLLKLSPEQEKFVNWALPNSGPTLVKGSPGTGKSTVALYRVRSILNKLRKEGNSNPRILFTTYTNALVNSSQQLLEQLLGSDVRHVKVKTADSIIYHVLSKSGQKKEIIEEAEYLQLLKEALKEPRFEGNLLQQQAQHHILEKLGYDYLAQEINTVIVARQLHSLQEYLNTARHGRKIRLNNIHRKVIWSIYEQLQALIDASGKETWQQRRARAAELVEQSDVYQSYDAVLIDEAQDLDPCALRFLVKLCSAPHHIFVTADANQSIYGSGFNWSDVHECLRFQGRTGVLRVNYRSTKEISEAAHSYLTVNSMLDEDIGERVYINEGPCPDARTVGNFEQEVHLLEHFFRIASRNLHLSLGSCVLLCPGENIGRSLAQKLIGRGIEATFMKGQDLNLKQSSVKILTLSSSKGLEFPIVALAGFIGSNYSDMPTAVSEEEREEILAKNRRMMFVGMTRAMRALLVVTPEDAESPVMQGFDPEYWSMNKNM